MAGKRILAVALFGAVALLSAPAFTGLSAQLRGSRAPAQKAFRLAGPAAQEAVDQSSDSDSPTRFGGAFVSMLAALVIAFAPVAEAQAGKMGGAAPSKAAPPAAAAAPKTITRNTTVINKTTVIQAAPVVAAPVVVVAPAPVMGMGYGMGMAPVVMAPPPTIGDMIIGAAVGSAINGAINPNRGSSTTDRVLENQQRQDERQLDKQAMQMESLQREMAALKK